MLKEFVTALVLACLVPAHVNADSRRAHGRLGAAPTRERVASVLLQRFGANVVNTQDYVVEVMPRAYGKVKAWVIDCNGDTVDPSDLLVAARVQGSDRKPHLVNLQWDRAKRLFSGFMPPGVVAAPGALSVAVTKAGRVQRGSIANAAVIPHPRVGGVVIAVGPYALEVVPHSDGLVEVVPDRLDEAMRRSTSKVVVQSTGGEPYTVALTWNVASGRFNGRVPRGVRLGTGPVDLMLSAGGRSYRGGVATAASLPTAASATRTVIAGPYVVGFEDALNGAVRASVWRNGRSVDGSETVQLLMNVHDREEGIYPVPLNWSPRNQRYEGRMPVALQRVV